MSAARGCKPLMASFHGDGESHTRSFNRPRAVVAPRSCAAVHRPAASNVDARRADGRRARRGDLAVDGVEDVRLPRDVEAFL